MNDTVENHYSIGTPARGGDDRPHGQRISDGFGEGRTARQAQRRAAANVADALGDSRRYYYARLIYEKWAHLAA